METRAGPEVSDKKKIIFSCRDSNRGPTSSCPSHCIDYAIPAAAAAAVNKFTLFVTTTTTIIANGY